jgi:tetratricopeptide (TPR) repeat protein
MLATLFATFLAAGPAAAAGSSPKPETGAAPPSAEDEARRGYNLALERIKKADEMMAEAAKEGDVGKRAELEERARRDYDKAVLNLREATERSPKMHEAFNMLGYAQRKLGRHDQALQAYDRALALQPDYGPALEYRGEAYLDLGRLDDAKEAYMTLSRSDPARAAELLGAMERWLAARRAAPGDVEAATLDRFAAWVEERKAEAGGAGSAGGAGRKGGW